MTVHISQDEMNILNLNGISVEDAKANVDYLRATGLSDVEIRNQFSNTIEELRPLTKQSANDTGNIQVWKAKGSITPFEEGKRKSVKFDGTYSNIDENANLSNFDKALKNSKRNQEVEKNISDIEQKKSERNKRVNEGTGSLLDRVGAFIDRVGEGQAKAAMDSPDDLSIQMSGINNSSKIDKSQKIGFQEALANSYASGAWIPFAGGWITGSEDKKQRDIIERIRNCEAIRVDELNYINHKIQQKQEENVRGYSLGGNITKDFLPSLVRFGTELGVGGWVLKSLGLGTKVTESASLGQKALAGLEDMVQTGIVNTALPTGWNNINEIYQSRMLDNTFNLTDKGESIFQESEEKPATALYKSIGQTFIMFASEASGGLLKLPIQGAGAAASKYIGSPIAKYLASNKQLVNFYKKSVPVFSKLYEKINKLSIKGENVDWLKSKVKYDGFIEELGEEVVEDVLNLTIGTNNEERSLENYAKAIFKSPDEWAVLAGAIALQGGTLSVASNILGNHMERNGATDEEIIETLNNLSENDKEKAVENLIQNGEINIDSTTEERIENNINNLTESLFDTGKYSSREQAEKVARLGVNMLSSIADKTGIDIEDLINEDMPNIEQDNRDTYVDENGIIHSGVSYNEQEQTLKDRYNNLVDELNNLPDDYSDEEHLNKMITETDLLEKIQSGEKLSIYDMESVNDLIEEYETNGNNNLANQLRQKLDNTNVDFGNTVVTQNGRNNADNIYHQSAMYRSPIKDFSDFYEQVFEKENHSKKNKSKISKSFYDYSTDNISVRVPHDTVVHDNNKHNLTSTEWKNVLNNLDKPTDAVLSNKPRFDGLPVLLKLVSNKNTYGVVVEFFENKQPIITTAFKDTEKNIDNWLKNGAVQSGTITSFSDISPIQETSWAWNTSTVTTMGMLPSSDSDNIINYVKTKLNPNVNKHEIKQHFQRANRDNLNSNIEENFNDTTENITSYIKGDIQNILEENNIDESEFKLEDIRIYGSYSTSSNKKGSDLDFLVQYSGIMKEDVAFNMFADSNLSITDKNGNDVKVDLNPINSSLSGTIDEHLDYYDNLEPAKKTYFQRATNNNNNVVDLTNDFEKAPSIDDVKAYINEIVENGTKFATLSPNWFVDVKGGRRTTNKILNAGNYKNLEKMGRKRHNKYIMSLEKLLANAEYAGEKENTKKDKKPNVEKYYYFKTDVKIGNKIYQLIFDTEEYKNDNKKSTSVGYAKRNLNETEVDTNIINDNAENINPKTVHLYNIKEIKNPLLYQKQRKMFIDNDKVEEIANRLVQVKGSFIPAENLVKLFKDADESTIVHEFAHWWLEKLVKHSEGNEELQEDLKEIRKFVKNNGEEFTDEQHERFARGFEAYMRTGSAKTNRLKKLFEDFKNALLSLYDSIKSLGFEESEIPEINNLFDRLLTTENQRIQAAVFDRCNTIQSQIEEIRTNQEKELSEIDEIEKNNLERSLQDTRKKQQVEEYLNLADKASSRVPKSVKEYSKRCRQACYEILSAALNHKYSIKYLQMTLAQNNVKAENLRQELSEVDDDITALGGMQANWYEFFGDTGVNYDTDETDGDAKLVEQALDRIDSNNFTPPESYPGEDIIGKFMGAFDFLSEKVLSLRGVNKDAAFEALSELFSGRKFGNLIELNRLPQDVMNEISVRMDEISKTYIEQKTNERKKYAIPNVSLSTQLRTYVSHKLHETKSYDPIEKKYIRLSSVNKLFSLLPIVNNSFTAKEVVRTINAHAIKQLENRQKYILHKEIQKQVKINSKLIKVGALKQGKFDWKTNTVFAELQQMNRLKKDEARTQYLRLIDADSAVIGEERDNINQNATSDIKAPTDFQGILKVKFLEYKSNDPKNLNLSATRSLLEDILQLKFEGRRAKNEQDLEKALTRYDYKNNLIEIMDKHRNNKVAKYLARWTAGDTIWTSEGTLANWESLLTGIFDKATAEKYSLLKSEADVEVYAHKKALGFYKRAMNIYNLNRSNEGLKNKILNVWDKALDFDNIQPLVDLFKKYDETNYPFKQVTWNKDTGEFVETTVELNHSQLITLYAWSLNPELKKRLVTQFVGEDVPNGAEKLDELMFSKLSEEDKLFAWAMVDTCDTMYEDTNEVFIRTTGLSLPKVDNYIPSKTERIGSDLDMMHETMLRSTNPSFIKQRKNCSRIKMDPISPLEIILPHINKTARYVVMSEKVNFYNRIFQSPDIKAKMVEIYGKKSGEKIHRILLNQLATSTYDNYAKSITVGKNLIDNIASNYITSKIGGNLKVMFSQLTSMVNYCENMPFGMWSKGFSEALAHPKKTVDFMFKNCEYLQARLAGNSQNEIISMLTNESDKFRALRNFCTSNTKYGDIIAIMFGGKPYVDYLMSQGMSQEEAFTKFTEDTLRSQQSGHSSATSAWQKQVAQHAITRMFFAFNNTNFQYERKIVDAMANLTKGDISKEEFMKSFLIYKVFNPILFTSFLSDLSLLILFQNMFGGGDDDPLFAFGSDIINAIFLSNWKAYGVLGTLANSIVSLISAKATGGTYFEDKLPLISDFETSINKLLKGKNLELADYIEMLAGAGDYSTGIAASRLYNAAGGIGDMMQGELGTGLLRFVGYGRYRANMAATGEPPERKKK